MKIIQSYAQHAVGRGSPYLNQNQLNNTENYSNFYSYFLSYLCLKKYYGSVRMYTNQDGYDTLIKYIPYDEIVIKENQYYDAYWSFYKVDMIGQTDGDVVHVDSDVFIFDSLLNPFVIGRYDGIVQDILTPFRNKSFCSDFVNDNRNVFIESGLVNPDLYDGRCFSCGVIGMRENMKNEFVKFAKWLKENFDNNVLRSRYNHLGAICEELGFYLLSLEKGLNIYSILPYDEVIMNEKNYTAVANKHKYTHLWFTSKYKANNIELIKNKIKKEFSDSYHYVENFENMLSVNNIKLILL